MKNFTNFTMATWITLQTSDLYDYLGVTQLNALKNLELAGEHTKPIDEIVDDVTSRIRAEISGNKNNLLSADRTKIPQELKCFACYLVLECAQTRLPALKLTADQIRLASDAKEYLKRIAQGEIPISMPEDPIVTSDFSTNFGCDVVHSRPRRVSGKTLKGL
jgi:hypothetical protein